MRIMPFQKTVKLSYEGRPKGQVFFGCCQISFFCLLQLVQGKLPGAVFKDHGLGTVRPDALDHKVAGAHHEVHMVNGVVQLVGRQLLRRADRRHGVVRRLERRRPPGGSADS